jgi:hypothetical protein
MRSLEAEPKRNQWIKKQQKLQFEKEKAEAAAKPPPKSKYKIRKHKPPAIWDSQGRIIPVPEPPEEPPEVSEESPQCCMNSWSHELIRNMNPVPPPLEVRNLQIRSSPIDKRPEKVCTNQEFHEFMRRQDSSIEKRTLFIDTQTKTPKRVHLIDEHSQELIKSCNKKRKKRPKEEELVEKSRIVEESKQFEIRRWMGEIGRETVRQMNIELMRLEQDAKNREIATFQPDFISEKCQRDAAGEKKDEILAIKQKRFEELKATKKKEERTKRLRFHPNQLPPRTRKLYEILHEKSRRDKDRRLVRDKKRN